MASLAARKSLATVKRRVQFALGGVERRRRVQFELVEDACLRAFNAYRPQRCDVPIMLIRCSQAVRYEEEAVYDDWAELTSELDVRVVQAAHETMFDEPQVAELATAIAARLKQLDEVHAAAQLA